MFFEMLKKYDDFIEDKINESVENELYYMLMESSVVFSNNFRKVLSKIDNPISNALLSIENKDLPVSANYFDIDNKRNDYLFFTPDRKAQEILNDPKQFVKFIGNNGGWLKHSEANESIFKKLGYVPGAQVYVPSNSDVGEIVNEILSSKSGKTWCYVKFDEGEGVFNKEKLREIDKEKLVWKSNRQDIKVGRSMNALLGIANKNDINISYTPKDIENFVNLYKMQIDKLNDKFSLFEIVDGRDIEYWYNNENYLNTNGSLGSSCMSDAPDYFFKPYVLSPNVSLVIYKSEEDDEVIIGRALLWKLETGETFMDRIYTTQDSDVELFRQYAKENGWMYKRYNNSSNDGDVVMPDGSYKNMLLTAQTAKDIESFPYLDTLKYYSPDTGLMSNKSIGVRSKKMIYFLEATDGGYDEVCGLCDGEEYIKCDKCNGVGTIVDENDHSIQCDDCEGSGFVECSVCR